MARRYKPEVNLKKLEYFENHNPLLESTTVRAKNAYVQTAAAIPLADARSGELVNIEQTFRQVKQVEDAEYVKIFRQGINAMYDLTITGQRTFGIVLHEYERTPMRHGYAQSIQLFYNNEQGTLNGQPLNVNRQTYLAGLKELLDKRFLAPRIPNSYWVNPQLFFKGDKLILIKEYHRKHTGRQHNIDDTPNDTVLPNPGDSGR